MPQWEYFLCDSANMGVIQPIRQARNKRLQLIYNRPGSFSCQVPIDSEVAIQARKHSQCILAVREGVPKWSGPIFTITDAVPDDVTTITAMGWMEELNRRFVSVGMEPFTSYKDRPGGFITSNLLINLASFGYPTRIPTVVISDTQLRTRTYKRGQNIGAAIKELIDIENGMDVSVDPITRTLYCDPPDAWQYRPNALLGYNVFPKNVAAVTRTEDGTRTANTINVQSQSGSVFTVAPPDDINIAGIMLEDWLSVSDVNDPGVIGGYANGEQLYRRYGVTEYTITPKVGRGDAPIRIFDDFELGDAIYLSVDRGRLQVQGQAVRVFGATIIDDGSGEEVLTELVLSPQ